MAHSSDIETKTRARSARPEHGSSVPSRVGPWQLVRLVATERYTRVFAARPADAPEDATPGYALKLPVEEDSSDSVGVELIRREAVAARAVNSPHVISVLAARVSQPPYYIVMPWLCGSTLRARLARPEPLCLPAVLGIVRQVAEGLGGLLETGWLHGDVKPDNIMVSPEGHATLIDLGFARRVDETGWCLDRGGFGTLSYVAPEVVTSAVRSDVRSDIYSLGVTLYESLSGRLPFSADSASELARRHRDRVATDIHTLVPRLPLRVVRLLRSMLAKQPCRRPQSPAELVERLVALEIETLTERNAVRNGVKGTTNEHEMVFNRW